jgi:hypothetical protein
MLQAVFRQQRLHVSIERRGQVLVKTGEYACETVCTDRQIATGEWVLLVLLVARIRCYNQSTHPAYVCGHATTRYWRRQTLSDGRHSLEGLIDHRTGHACLILEEDHLGLRTVAGVLKLPATRRRW